MTLLTNELKQNEHRKFQSKQWNRLKTKPRLNCINSQLRKMFSLMESSFHTIQPNMFIATRFDDGGASILNVISWLASLRLSSLSSTLLSIETNQNKAMRALQRHRTDGETRALQKKLKGANGWGSRNLISPLCPPDTFSETRCGARMMPMDVVGCFPKTAPTTDVAKLSCLVSIRPNLVMSAHAIIPVGGPEDVFRDVVNCRV